MPPVNTPMMQQYLRIKELHPDCILFFRLGDFYEMFNEDAKLASRELELTLTSRDRGKPEDQRTPMCGVPYHSADAYIARLIAKGYKVAICEQMEDPATAKGLVDRDIIRIVTPGTVMTASMLEEGRNNYICAVYRDSAGTGVCFCDISTGECAVTAFDGPDTDEHLYNELGRYAPREAMLSDGAYSDAGLVEFLTQKLNCRVENGGEGRFRLDAAKTAAEKQFPDGLAQLPCDAAVQAVEDLVNDAIGREELIHTLREITDLERLIGRIVYGTAGGRDLVSLAAGLGKLPQLRERLAPYPSALLKSLSGELDDLEELRNLIGRAIVDEPPFSVREGGFIRLGYDAEVDRLRDIQTRGKDMVLAIEAREKEKTGIKSLKVGFNKVFGYYIEVSKSYYDQVPADYIRKQTLVNCERFITQELKDLEHEILTSQDRLTALEFQLFCELREQAAAQVGRIQRSAAAVAQVDVLCSFAAVAAERRYCRPEVDLSDRIDITEGWHPVVEKMLTGAPFVPNDAHMDLQDDTVAIITGPNMAGKCTYMRQVALIVLMAQMGSFVPAKAARIGVVDRVFTRIGASDDLSAGQSTFMVEMTEVAELLKNATAHSLLILDEIGRGTSTYDGMAIARSVLEYCADRKKLGAKTLFATHYHELTALEGLIPGVKNYNIAAKKKGDTVLFLRKIVRGGADQSYGIEVAQLAGVPEPVLKRARKILSELEEGGAPAPAPAAPARAAADDQVSLLDMGAAQVADRLRQVDVNVLTPIEAMNLVYELKQML